MLKLDTVEKIHKWKEGELGLILLKATTEKWDSKTIGEEVGKLKVKYAKLMNTIEPENGCYHHYEKDSSLMVNLEGAKEKIEVDGKSIVLIKRFTKLSFIYEEDHGVCLQSLFRKDGKNISHPCCSVSGFVVCNISAKSLKEGENAELILRKCTQKYKKEDGGGNILCKLNVRIKKGQGKGFDIQDFISGLTLTKNN